MQEAQSISILAPPRLDACAGTIRSQDRQLAMLFTLRGENATSEAKDLETECQTWQITSPEQLHQHVLDLLSNVRQKNLSLELALCHLQGEQITFATYAGEVTIKRRGQAKKILTSQGEIKLIVGKLQEGDQIILSNLLQTPTVNTLSSLLESDISLEKLVGELTLLRQKQGLQSDNLVFVSYVEKTTEQTVATKRKINWSKIAQKTLSFAKKISYILKKIYLAIKRQGKRRILTILSILLGISLLILGINSLVNYQQAKATASAQEQVNAIKGASTDFNQLLLSQPLQARERANQQLQALQALKEKTKNKDSLQIIEAEIAALEKLISSISAENSLDQLAIAYNLGDFLGQKMISSSEGLFILENNQQDILWLSADQSQENLRLTEGGVIRDFTISDGKLFVLSQGIWLLDLSSNERQWSRIKEEGESDKSANLAASFGPYLYLLNPEKRNVYRYHFDKGQLSEPIGWLIDKQGLGFDQISDLLIDGDLWLSDKNGQIFKFSRGSKLDWQIAGLSSLPSSSLLLAQNEVNNQLVALEKQQRRLLLLTKEGQLISEIKSNELAGVTSLAFQANGQKLYALSGSVIYEIDLLK